MKKILVAILALTLMMGLCITASAEASPSADKYNKVVILNGIGAVKEEVQIKEGETTTIKVNPEISKFSSWSVYTSDGKPAKEGTDYVLTAGTLKSKEIVIKPLADLIVCGNYGGYFTDPSTGKAGDPISPVTGDMTLVFASIVMLAAFGLGFAAKKQLAK